MATRPVLPRLTLQLSRSVVHHARPPRVPVFRNPHDVPITRPTEGTSTAHPAALNGGEAPAASTSSTQLEGTNLTFHHSPPPTAPSYTTGAVPDLLRWTAGEPVSLTGEEAAPLRKPQASVFTPRAEWDEATVKQIVKLRAEGRSRSEIGKKLNIPRNELHRISHVAPLSKEQRKELEDKLEEQKEGWGARKSLSRDIRQRRKAFW